MGCGSAQAQRRAAVAPGLLGSSAEVAIWAVEQGQCAGRWVWRAAVEGMVYGVLHRAALPLTAGTAQLARRAQQAAVSSCSLTPPDAEPCSHVCRDLWMSLAAAQRFWDCAADDTFSDAFGHSNKEHKLSHIFNRGKPDQEI